MSVRPIDADALCEGRVSNDPVVIAAKCEPTLDLAPVVHGEWELEARAFFKDNPFDEIDLCVYVIAKCSKCGRKHPDASQVYSKDVYAEDCNALFDVEREKQLALEEFRKRSYPFSNYCPNCGAKMDGRGKG